VPDPRIYVEPSEDNVHAWGWTEGTLLTLTIDDPNSTNDYTANKRASGTEDWDHGFMLGGIFDIQPGFVVTVSGGGFTKEHTVTPLAVTNIDIDADTVSGVGLPGSWVHVGTVCDDTGCANRNITVGDDSTWLADFSIPQIGNVDGGMVFDIRLGSGSGAFEHDEDGDSTKVNWSVFNPTIGVEVDTERVQGWDWPLGATVHFEFDDPSTSENPDYTYDAISQPSNWDPNSMWFNFYSEYDIKPGDIVTATDGHVTKELVVTTYRITSVDLDTDIVYGIAEPFQPVKVWTCYPGACVNRSGVVAGPDGSWSANFGIPGEGEGEIIVDLRPGSSLDSFVGDEDWDNTRWMWDVPNPIIGVRANENRVEGWEWTPDTTITITVDDPETPAEPDITRFANVYEASWNPGEYRFDLDLNGVIDIQTGFVVTATDGYLTKTHTVQPLAFTEIDLDADTVHGIATSGQTINIWTCWQNVCINRDETADANGNWSTNFSIPGEQDWEQETADLRPGSWIDSSVNDDDNDQTMYGWSVLNPNFSARLTDNEVHGYSWPLDATVTLTIDDPDTVEPVDYTASQKVIVADWDPNQTFVPFRLWENGFTLEPGMTVTMSDGDMTKTHVVTNLMVTAVDPNMDTVSGTAEPGAQIEIGHIYCNESGCFGYRRVFADEAGEWIADFAHVGEDSDEQDIIDITIGMGNEARQCDDDWDCTQYGWAVPSYTLHAVPTHPEVHGHDWTAGSTVTLIIDNDADPTNGVLYTRTKNADDDPWCGYPCFDLAGEFELEVGQYVTMTDGLASKMVLVSRLKITDVDYEHETVSGIADPGSRVAVNIWSQDGKARYVTVDAAGHWVADFSTFGDEDFEQFTTDITSEDNGRAIQLNPDGTDDGTLEYWPIFNNPPVADAGPDQTIYARDPILLDASASSDPDGDTLTYEWDLNNDGQYDDASGVTVTTTFSLPGTYTVGLLVTDDSGLSSMDTVTITVLPWTLRGFYQPVDMNGVYNLVKNGSTVPLKFEIFSGSTELTDTTAVKSLTYAQVVCGANAITDEIEVVSTGGTSLRYDAASGLFIFNWKTPKTAGACYRVTMTTMDGSSLVAYFKLK